jgi:(2Fe-2S) ferredoxin
MSDRNLAEIQKATEGRKSLGGETTLEPIAHSSDSPPVDPIVDPIIDPIVVQVCCHRSCRKLGAIEVLNAFQANPVLNVVVVESGCLGQCGNGPMVLVCPEQTWYWQVQPDEVKAIVDRHLQGGRPVLAMLYPKLHPRP